MNKILYVFVLSSCAFIHIYGSEQKKAAEKTTLTLQKASAPMKLLPSASVDNKDSSDKKLNKDSLATAPSTPKLNTLNNADTFDENEYEKYRFICPCSKPLGKRWKIPAKKCYEYDREECNTCTNFCCTSLQVCCGLMIGNWISQRVK